MRVFFFRSRSSVPDGRTVLAMHGFDHAAAAFRDALVDQAQRLGVTVLVPEFDPEAFPDANAYDDGLG